MLDGAWNIRPAGIHDARAIAEVHTESYNGSYRGIFPDSLLNGLSVEKRESRWRDLLAGQEPSSAVTIVGCEAGGSVAGFASGGKERTGQLGCDGELYAIYLRPEAQRKGQGTLVVRQFARELIGRGFGSMAVWVLELNPSRRFYECLGGRLLGSNR